MPRTGRELLAALGEVALDTSQMVPSPCISVCRMHPATGWCLGCFRTIDEIMRWGRLPDADKRKVWQLVLERAALPPA